MRGLEGIKSIENFELKDKNVFLRLDLNVPLKNGEITDTTRIDGALPTIRYALDRGARLVLGSHLGRPDKVDNPKTLSLEPVAQKLGELLNCEVLLIEDPDSDAPKELLKTLRPNQLLLLENLRFSKDETKNGEDLARDIAAYTDIYINDAFGASHRKHASIVGIPQFVKQKGIGFLMRKELEMLDKIKFGPEKPFAVILGGAKVSDKMGVIELLIDSVDVMCIGGAMAYTFLVAKDIEVGKSLVEKAKVKYAKELIDRIEARKMELVLPVDHRIVTDFEKTGSLQVTSTDAIPKTHMAIDIGPKTEKLFAAKLSNAKTVFWNGPMGVFETEAYASGTNSVAQAVVNSGATSIVGGGDSASAIRLAGLTHKVTHVSTGGGASLEYLQGDQLPGVECLRSREKKSEA